VPEVFLNLGAGEKPLAIAQNIDLRPLPGVDMVADASKLPLPDNHDDKIIASDLLEHFPRAEVPSVLLEWKRILKSSGGVLILKTPNLRTISEMFVSGVFDAPEAARRFYANQGNLGDFHKAGWDGPYLRRLVEDAGFKIVRHIEKMDPPDETNQSLRAVKP